MKVFRVSDTDWYAAERGEDAFHLYLSDTGLMPNEVGEGYPLELTPEQMESLEYIDFEGEFHRSAMEEPFTFAQALALRVEEGARGAFQFATSEY